MQIRYLLAALSGVGLALAVTACGDDDDDDNGGGNNACADICAQAPDAGCGTVAECSGDCDTVLGEYGAACPDEIDAYKACLLAADDLACNAYYDTIPDSPSCEDQLLAVLACAAT